MEPIYADHAATTPMRPEVTEAMLPYFYEHFGNPSSIHHFGRKAKQALDESREKIAQSLGASSSEIVFTSGGTEADNLAIAGYAYANRHKGNHIVTTTIEHHAVLHTCKRLEEEGFDVTYVPVGSTGAVSVEDVEKAMREDTILVTLMYGNNETGVVQPIAEIGKMLKEREQKVAFHTDAVQAYGLINLHVSELPVDMLSISGHKINGPKGIGALYVRKEMKLRPFITGGEQERKRRAGTENVAAAVGFAKAAALSVSEQNKRFEEDAALTRQFISVLEKENVDYVVNGIEADLVLPHIVNISFPGLNVESLLMNLDLSGIAVSSGSACTAGSVEPSHVLKSMYGDGDRLYSSIRFSVGYGNTNEQMERMAKELKKITERLKNK